MADIAFSGSGAPNISKQSGTKVPVPTFFPNVRINDDEISLDTVATPRERALAKDAADNNTMSGAPKL